MKAPDKIYIDDLAVVNDCGTKVSVEPLPNFSEYIRKDYLLEWADKELDRLYELLPDASNDNPSQIELRHLGQYMQTEKLIDKLNEI